MKRGNGKKKRIEAKWSMGDRYVALDIRFMIALSENTEERERKVYINVSGRKGVRGKGDV